MGGEKSHCAPCWFLPNPESRLFKNTLYLMTTTTRNLLILFLLLSWVLYTVLVYRGCYDTLCPPCGEQEEAVIIVPPGADNPYELSFSWANDTPFVKPTFEAIRDSLVGQTSETRILTITGKYFQEEAAPEGFDDMGMARAERVRSQLFGELPRSQVRLMSSAMSPEPEGAREGYFRATAFDHIEPVNDYPLAFLWMNPKPFAGEGIKGKIDSIMALSSGNDILEITGLYYEGETTVEQNIGLERARLIREQFFADLPEERIRLRARADQNIAYARDHYFQAAQFEWISTEETISETVEELADRIIIRFPYNSVEKDYDPAVDEYLQKLAQRVKETGEAVRLTGHTDDTGTSEYNMDLGLRRAQQIRLILINKGVPAGQINVESKGETQAVALNTTEEGRHENRRVEVRLIKQENESK